ncbi:purine-cytosine permease family protein [Nocardia sp. alder85J]|uniref:purine-cytosine permease family protein n=1 Tax=Nocardia sp. alder85J TaxID=2862949 RepID=UPI001CD443DB|nr:cytosine permease [Nocardia sp. alder85J]MCX4091847.1 cytosine permease [Nocardia sp. alder85J]
MSTNTHEVHLDFTEEYEHEPVPMQARRSLSSIAAVWFGFPMNLGNTVFGGVIVYNLGTVAGLSAILLGNLALFGYVGALSFIAGRTGRSFSLQAAATFGDRGRIIAAAFLATVVLGWFSFQIGLTGTTLRGALGWSAVAAAIIGGVLYTAVTIVGIRALSWLGMIAAPLFLVLAVVALIFGASHGSMSFGDIVSYHGAGTTLSFGAAVSIVIAGFADSGTMTADFTRWSSSGRSAVAATFTAFPVANFLAYAIGGLVVAVGGSKDPATDGGGFLDLLTGHGVALTAVAVVFVFINLGSVASHCLYNGAVGWSGITKFRMRTVAIVLGVVGLIVAATGVWSSFLDWLNLLGIFVPPIGAVLIMDQLVLRRDSIAALAYRPTAFAAWALGAAAATASHYLVTGSIDSLVGIVAAAVAYAVLEPARRYAAARRTTAPAAVSSVAA